MRYLMHIRHRIQLTAAALVACTLGLSTAFPVQAQTADQTPLELTGVGIEEHLDAQLPLDATFVDAAGKQVTLGDYFDGERPVVILPVYFSCPMLCGLTANALLDSAQQVPWTPGDEYRIIVFSFDPRETERLASLKKQNYLKEFDRPIEENGWVFLTGDEPQIQRLTDTLGFYYKWNDKRQEFAHAAGLMICTPDGRISQYMYGVIYDAQTMRLLLVEASEGKVGSAVDRFLLYCFHYNPEEGSYAWAAVRVMRLGGTVTLVALTVVLVPLWLRSSRKQRRYAEIEGGADSTNEQRDA